MDKVELLRSNEKPEGLSREDELAWTLARVMRWQNPNGTIADAYVPPWLRDLASEALGRYTLDAQRSS